MKKKNLSVASKNQAKDYDNLILKQAFAFPDEDEMDVAIILIDKGAKSILFLSPNLTPGAKTPDIRIDERLNWEIKTPRGKSSDTLWRAFQTASKQSENIIFYLKYYKIAEKPSLIKLKNIFLTTKRAKRLKIITKSKRIIDYAK